MRAPTQVRAHSRGRAHNNAWKPTGSCMPEGANTSSGILRLCKLQRLSKHGKVHTTDGAHTRPCVALTPTERGRSVHFPPCSGTAAVSERHLRPAGSGRTCSPRSPGARAFVVLVSGHPSRGVRARRSTKWRLGGGERAGRPGAVYPFPTLGRARHPPSGAGAQRGARSRVSSDARQDTKGRRESTERDSAYGAAGGPERPGADRKAGAGLAGTARSGAGWGVGWGAVRRSCPSPRPPSTAVRASRAGVGAQGAGAVLVAAAAAGRAGSLHFPSRVLMAGASHLSPRAEQGLASGNARGLLQKLFFLSALKRGDVALRKVFEM